MFHLALLLSAALPAVPSTQETPARVPIAEKPHATAEHGKLPWFQGTFEELLAEAAKTKKLVFMDFWTDWCGWCKRLDKDTFSDPAVVAAMSDILCYSVDAESEKGAPLAQRYGARGYPYLVFAEPDGELCDRISGYLPPADFLREVKRIQYGENTLSELRQRVASVPGDVFERGALMQRLQQMNDAAGFQREAQAIRDLVERPESFDRASAYQRWRIAQLLRQAGDEAGATAQTHAIRQLQPGGQTWLERRQVLEQAINSASQTYQQKRVIDSAPLELFTSTDQPPELLYDAWLTRRNLEAFRANESARAGKPEDETLARAAARNALHEAWKLCTRYALLLGRFQRECARLRVEDRLADAARNTPEELASTVEVARVAVEAASSDASMHELLARALFAQGHVDRAVAALEKTLELAPNRVGTRKRLAEYRAALTAAK